MWLWVCESVFACISVRMLCAHETDWPVIRYLGEWPVTGPGWKHWKLAVLFPGYWISSCLLVEMWRTLSFRGKVWFPTHALVSFKWNSWPQVTFGEAYRFTSCTAWTLSDCSRFNKDSKTKRLIVCSQFIQIVFVCNCNLN